MVLVQFEMARLRVSLALRASEGIMTNLFEDAEIISSYSREQCVALPTRYRGLEDVKGRLWDVLSMFRFAARVNSGDRLLYRLKVSRRLVTLKAIIGPGDTAEPVVTIMTPEED
jgi:uncharacterized protein DUF6573